jgi:hypothetical protein
MEYFKEFKKIVKVKGLRAKINKIESGLTKGYEWYSLPEYATDELSFPFVKLYIPTQEDRKELSRILDIDLKDKLSSLYWPHRPETIVKGTKFITTKPVVYKYPIYVISKGRWESRLTIRSLEGMNVPFNVVVEPQEYDKYASVVDHKKIIILPDEYLNKNQGSIPVRNFVWKHATDNGYKKHWVLDDNLDHFFRLNRNKKLRIDSGVGFKVIEDYCDRYENIGIAGMQYSCFVPQRYYDRPVMTENTRVYSCIFINHELLDKHLEERWRGRYNEDTDLSLRVLKKGLATCLFNNFLCGKITTMSMKGGNTDSIYTGTGLYDKIKSLVDQHPDCVKFTYEKFDRPHHQVDYKPFKNNKLIKKQGLVLNDVVNNYGMQLKSTI